LAKYILAVLMGRVVKQMTIKESVMGVAAMVIGIISAVLAFIPMCGYIAFVPAIIGLILGVVDVALRGKKKVPKGKGIAGIVLNAVAIALIFLWTVVLAAGAVAADDAFDDYVPEVESYEFD